MLDNKAVSENAVDLRVEPTNLCTNAEEVLRGAAFRQYLRILNTKGIIHVEEDSDDARVEHILSNSAARDAAEKAWINQDILVRPSSTISLAKLAKQFRTWIEHDVNWNERERQLLSISANAKPRMLEKYFGGRQESELKPQDLELLAALCMPTNDCGLYGLGKCAAPRGIFMEKLFPVGYITIGDIWDATDEEFQKIPGLGPTGRSKILTWIQKVKDRLGTSVPNKLP